MNMKESMSVFVVLIAVLGLINAAPALADSRPTARGNGQPGEFNGGGDMTRKMAPSVFGTVTAISNNTITVSGKSGFGTSTVTLVYTVDASSAKIEKNNTESTVSSVSVGDTVMIEGTITGTSIVATNIRDGAMPNDKGMVEKGGKSATGTASKFQGVDMKKLATSTNKIQEGENGKGDLKRSATSTANSIQGDGQPVIAGTISAISGTSLTITNKNSSTNYSVDASNAKILSGNSTSSISNLNVGDTVVIQGTINGTSIMASSVIDQNKSSTDSTKTTSKGFFGKIGSFIGRLFGF